MANYIFNIPETISAEQYTGENSPFDQVNTCYIDWNGIVAQVPGDMLGSSDDDFAAIKVGEHWQRIEVGDWIINDRGTYHTVSNGVFNLFFLPA